MAKEISSIIEKNIFGLRGSANFALAFCKTSSMGFAPELPELEPLEDSTFVPRRVVLFNELVFMMRLYSFTIEKWYSSNKEYKDDLHLYSRRPVFVQRFPFYIYICDKISN